METAYFNPDGAPIKVKIVYRNGVIAAGYNLKLSERESNRAVFYYDGDNLNPEDDIYELPAPVETNDGRIVRLSNEFYGLDPGNSHDFEIVLEVYQGETLINSNSDRGIITGQTQSSLMFTKIIKQK
jgi:hypothetical protein